MALAVGTRLGPYEIQSSLGAGGRGEVYRATDTKLGRDIALKVLPADRAHDPERLARFRREAKALAQLDHPNIVTIHSVEESDGIHFLTMQLVEGLPLDRLIRIWRRPQPTGNLASVTKPAKRCRNCSSWIRISPWSRVRRSRCGSTELVEHLIDSLRKAGLEIGAASG
jgi:serine/threonine protein kinase